MANKKISDFTRALIVALNDWLEIETAGGNSRKVTGQDVADLTAKALGPGGRLTLVTATPVLTSDQTAKTTIYYTPACHDVIPIWDATNGKWVFTTFSELTLSLDTTNHTSGSLYDVFVWNNAGTISIGTGPAWSSTTTRGTGAGTTEIERKNGIWTNKNSITLKNGAGSGTSGVAANTALFVGTFYATANGQTGMAFTPAAAAGGTNNILAVCNAYNRRRASAINRDSTASWSRTNGSWEVKNIAGTGSGLNNRISYVDCLGDITVDGFAYELQGAVSTVAIGMVRDGTTATPQVTGQGSNVTGGAAGVTVEDCWPGSLGFHFIQEEQESFGTTTLNGAQSGGRQTSWLKISLEM